MIYFDKGIIFEGNLTIKVFSTLYLTSEFQSLYTKKNLTIICFRTLNNKSATGILHAAEDSNKKVFCIHV